MLPLFVSTLTTMLLTWNFLSPETFSKLYSNFLKRNDNEERDSALLISGLKLYFKFLRTRFLTMVKSFLSVVAISTGRKKLAVNPGLPVYLWTILINLPPFYPVSHRDNQTIDNFKIIKVMKFSCCVLPPAGDVCPKLPCLHNCFRKWPS